MLPEISRSMLKNALVLGLFAVVTVGVVGLTQQGTAARREFDAEVADLQERRIVRCGGHLASNLNAVWD